LGFRLEGGEYSSYSIYSSYSTCLTYFLIQLIQLYTQKNSQELGLDDFDIYTVGALKEWSCINPTIT